MQKGLQLPILKAGSEAVLLLNNRSLPTRSASASNWEKLAKAASISADAARRGRECSGTAARPVGRTARPLILQSQFLILD